MRPQDALHLAVECTCWTEGLSAVAYQSCATCRLELLLQVYIASWRVLAYVLPCLLILLMHSNCVMLRRLSTLDCGQSLWT